MKAKKPRGVFWVVSTHVVTTGFAMPILAGLLVGFGVAFFLPGLLAQPLLFLPLALGVQALAYVGGTYYSFSYLRRVAIIQRPEACIVPSIVTFAIAAALFFAWTIKTNALDTLEVGIEAAFYVAVTVVFAWITRREFHRIAQSQQYTQGFEVLPIQPPPNPL